MEYRTTKLGAGAFTAFGSDKGSRVYYRDTKEGGFEILGYSNKNNQDQVIQRIENVYGNTTH